MCMALHICRQTRRAFPISQALKFDPIFAEQFATLCNYWAAKLERNVQPMIHVALVRKRFLTG